MESLSDKIKRWPYNLYWCIMEAYYALDDDVIKNFFNLPEDVADKRLKDAINNAYAPGYRKYFTVHMMTARFVENRSIKEIIDIGETMYTSISPKMIDECIIGSINNFRKSLYWITKINNGYPKLNCFGGESVIIGQCEINIKFMAKTNYDLDSSVLILPLPLNVISRLSEHGINVIYDLFSKDVDLNKICDKKSAKDIMDFLESIGIYHVEECE